MNDVNEISVDIRLCKACGICVSLCPRGCLRPGDAGVPEVYEIEKCIRCHRCEYHCPDFAIRIKEA